MSAQLQQAVELPRNIVTRRFFPRLFAVAVIVIGSSLIAYLTTQIAEEDISIPSFLDGALRIGESRWGVRFQRDLIGELVVTMKHDREYSLEMQGSYGFQSSLAVRASFTEYRYLKELTLQMLEPGRALELLIKDGERSHLLVRDGESLRELFLTVPSPILLRSVADDSFGIVAPAPVQELVSEEGIQIESLHAKEQFVELSLIGKIEQRLNRFVDEGRSHD